MKQVKKTLALAMSALMLLAMLTGCGSSKKDDAPAADSNTETQEPAADTTSSKLDQIKANGKLLVGTEAQYAPYEFKDLDANFAGCDMWLAQQIADSLGVELEVVDMSFDGIIPAVKSGQVDIGIAAFTKTPERAEEIDFSDLYETSAQFLVVKTGNADVYSTKEALAGQKVGAQKGTIQSQLIQSALPDSELFELEKYPALALEVQNGKTEGAVMDELVAQAYVNADPSLAISPLRFDIGSDSGIRIGVQKGNDEFVTYLNQVIAEMQSQNLLDKYVSDAQALAGLEG